MNYTRIIIFLLKILRLTSVKIPSLGILSPAKYFHLSNLADNHLYQHFDIRCPFLRFLRLRWVRDILNYFAVKNQLQYCFHHDRYLGKYRHCWRSRRNLSDLLVCLRHLRDLSGPKIAVFSAKKKGKIGNALQQGT